ncbi:hypothetical protein, partial [Brevundimonas sp.]|uniref:hypothetical protein n=1 Tax=Brevundimonas sp. TaxID=1871086 RepID=UPI0025B8B33E
PFIARQDVFALKGGTAINLSNRVEGQPPYRVEVQPPWDLRGRAEVAPAELVGVARPGRFRRSVGDRG